MIYKCLPNSVPEVRTRTDYWIFDLLSHKCHQDKLDKDNFKSFKGSNSLKSSKVCPSDVTLSRHFYSAATLHRYKFKTNERILILVVFQIR